MDRALCGHTGSSSEAAAHCAWSGHPACRILSSMQWPGAHPWLWKRNGKSKVLLNEYTGKVKGRKETISAKGHQQHPEIGSPTTFTFRFCFLVGIVQDKYLPFRGNIIYLQMGFSHITTWNDRLCRMIRDFSSKFLTAHRVNRSINRIY